MIRLFRTAFKLLAVCALAAAASTALYRLLTGRNLLVKHTPPMTENF